MSDPYRHDGARLRRAFDRAARGYDRAAVLQARVRDELLSRLEVVRLDPAVVLDLGAGTGHASLALKRRYRAARVLAVDISPGMLAEAAGRRTLLRRFERVCADAAALPLRDASVDLVFSNLMLHWCGDPDAVFGESRRVLRPGGLLTFTTFGPDTLAELRHAWTAADTRVHVNRQIDMHDLGDALVRSGLAEPVMDVERYTLTYGTVRDLARDLRAMGSTNASAGRPRGLTGRQALGRMSASYEGMRREGRLPATFEVVYGHAWCPAGPRQARAAPAEVTVPIQAIGRRRWTS